MPRGREAEDSKEAPQLEVRQYPIDRAEKARLRVAVRQPLPIEFDAERTHQRDEKADDGTERSDAPAQADDFGLKFLLLTRKRLGGDDLPVRAPKPARGRRARNAKSRRDRHVASVAYKISEPVVIGALNSSHRRIIAYRFIGRARIRRELSRARRKKCRMSWLVAGHAAA